MEYVPNRVEVKRSEQIRFVIRRTSGTAHEFVLASTAENLKHAAADAEDTRTWSTTTRTEKRFDRRQNAEILWRFTKRGPSNSVA